MARKNRYEYSLLKETYRFLTSTTYRNTEDMDSAQRLLGLISDFLDKEEITLTRVSPRRTFTSSTPIPAPRSWTTSTAPDPNSYVYSPTMYHPSSYVTEGLTQAPRVNETEGESPF